ATSVSCPLTLALLIPVAVGAIRTSERISVGNSARSPESGRGVATPVRSSSPGRSLVASFVAMLLALVGIVAPAGSALAASAGGVTLTISYGGQEYDGTTVVEPGTSYTAALQYDATVVEPGGSVTLSVPDGITIDPSELDTSGNEVISSITGEGNDLTITFEDPIPGGISQGVFSIDFVFDEPEQGSELRPIEWELGPESTTTQIIV